MRSAILLSRLATLALAAVLAAGCGTQPPTSSPSGTASAPVPPTPSATASATGSFAPTATAAGSGGLGSVRVLAETVVDGLERPVFVTTVGDGSGRLFVAEQDGRIRVVKDGALSPIPFLDITDRVLAGGERGLLGVAFPPGFGEGRPVVYVHYSGEDGATVISELRLNAHDATVLDPASERLILTEPQPYPNHNGGWIGFDADGMLLIALGDGGAGGDPENLASDPGNLLGKMLRIDVLGAPAGEPYAIPADNPFADGADGRPEILHVGLRNPFRNSIDPVTGNLWIGDVGQGAWEEIDVAPAGARGMDFGWRRWEGRHCFDPSTGCDPTGVTLPVAEYGHGAGCSVIGGVVYHGDAIPGLRDRYLFSDYCSGTLWAIDAGGGEAQEPVVLLETGASVSSIGTGEDGEVYLTDLSGGTLLRLVPES